MDLTKIETKTELQRILMGNPKGATDAVWALIVKMRGLEKAYNNLHEEVQTAQKLLKDAVNLLSFI